VFDGPPDTLDAAALTAIYGEEDWSRTIRDADGADADPEDAAADAKDAQDPRRAPRPAALEARAL
jgi:phosphonate transport system ATP-binding protein